MATHSSVLAWRIPGMGEPGGLPTMGSHRVWHDWSYLAACRKLQNVKAVCWAPYFQILHPFSTSLWWWIMTMHACSVVQSCQTFLRALRLSPARLLSPWNSPGKNTGVDCHFLIQGISPTLGLNPCLLHLLHWQVSFFKTKPPGKPNNDYRW